MIIFALIIFLIVLSLLVFIHELGHFTLAKKFGVKVDEFGMGIPPRAWAKKVGETIYSLNWLPIGGFVKIKGEDFSDYDPKDKTNFMNKKPWQKGLILLAGIIMNAAFAVLLFYFVLGLNGWKSQPILLMDKNFKFPFAKVVETPNIVTFVGDKSPAENAGIKFGDQIASVSYNGESFYPKNIDELKGFLEDKENVPVDVSVKNINTGEESILAVTPEFSEQAHQPALGVGLDSSLQLDYTSTSDKIFAGFEHSVNIMVYSFSMLKNMISTAVETGDSSQVAQGVSGPVGIFAVFQAVLTDGGSRTFLALLDLTALLSISLAVMNLLPFPALDGGRLVFVIYEWVRGKPFPQKYESMVHQVGFIFLIGLIVLITFKDIRGLF